MSERASGLEAPSITCKAKVCGAPRDTLGTDGMRYSGRNPRQQAHEATECVKPVQVVQRTAGTYYPVVHSALDIPESEVCATGGKNSPDGYVTRTYGGPSARLATPRALRLSTR